MHNTDKLDGYNPFTSALLRWWLLGDVSATAVQDLAYNLTLLGVGDEELVTLAKMGTWGQYPSKINKHLCEYMETFPCHMPDPTTKKVPCKDTKTGKPMEEATAFFEPAKIVSELYDKDPDYFHAQ